MAFVRDFPLKRSDSESALFSIRKLPLSVVPLLLILYTTQRDAAPAIIGIGDITSPGVEVRIVGVRGIRRRGPVASDRPLTVILAIIPRPVAGIRKFHSTNSAVVDVRLIT